MARVLNHSRASGTAKVVLIGIANHDGDGGAWPTIETLSRYANKGERAVQYALRELVNMGELQIIQQGGGTPEYPDSKRPNRYLITVPVQPVAPDARGAASCTPGVQPVAPGAASCTRTNQSKSSNVGYVTGATGCTQTVLEVQDLEVQDQNLLRIASAARDATAQPKAPHPGFEAWWDAYGHKVDRKKAEVAYRAAIKKPGVTPESLLAAASAYIARQKAEGKHPAFTKHPTTWLHGENWNDERQNASRGGAPRPAYFKTFEPPVMPDDVVPDAFAKIRADAKRRRMVGS